MNFNDIFKSSVLENVSSVSLLDMGIALALAFCLGLFIFMVYKKTFNGVMYSSSFGVTLVALTMITTVVILAVTSNVVLSLGMVGALSIVRFRTAIKEPLDIAFLFWSIAVGIVLAAGMIPLAVIGSVVIGVILLVISMVFPVLSKDRSGGIIFVLLCAAVFTLNGCVSITSKLHQINTEFAVCGTTTFVFLTNFMNGIISAVGGKLRNCQIKSLFNQSHIHLHTDSSGGGNGNGIRRNAQFRRSQSRRFERLRRYVGSHEKALEQQNQGKFYMVITFDPEAFNKE